MKVKLSTALSVICLTVAGILLSQTARTEARGGAGAPAGQRRQATGQRPEIARQGPDDDRPVYAEGSLVEVLVNGRPLEKLYGRGRLYVEALRGAEYELRIRNPYPVRVAVALTVDGLNTIDASHTSRWDSSKWVIGPYGTITISGWQMSMQRARRFYFTTERDSYAAKLGRPSDLGLISAVFFRERGVPVPLTRRTRPYPLEAPGDDEADSKRDSQAAPDSGRAEAAPRAAGRGSQPRSVAPAPPLDDDYAATGIGRSVSHYVSWINLDLDPRPAAEVNIRYEYYDALVRLGLLPRRLPAPDPLQRRERARGFDDPRFCPEP